MKVLVTGGSGIVGHYVVDELLKRKHSVVNADIHRPSGLQHSGNIGVNASAKAAVELRKSWKQEPPFVQADISDYGQVMAAMDGCDAVASLASRPTPFNFTEEDILRTNTTAVWNVCRAAEQLKINRVVFASSYNALGAQATAMARWSARQTKPPEYFPLDSDCGSRAEDAYSISKWVGEHIADGFVRRTPSMSVASLRLTGVWDEARINGLRETPVNDPWERCQGFWTYCDIRDVGRAFALAIDAEPWNGHKRIFVNAADTMLNIPTAEALRTVYPKVPLKEPIAEYGALVELKTAAEVINWRPQYSWRD